MTKLTWNSKFETGVARLDADHRRLFTLYNELEDCLAAREAPGDVGKALASLLAALKAHFDGEEGWLTQTGCSAAEIKQHREEHWALLGLLDPLTVRVEKDRAYRPSTTDLKFIRDWLSKHTRQMDMWCTRLRK